LGKFKLEYKKVIEGYFLAPKCYAFKIEDGDMVRYKGAAKKLAPRTSN
jgi:hypothetical protein